MLLKTGVTHDQVQGPIWYACGVIESIYRANGLRFVITALTDGHADKPNSLHNKGLAVDIRTRDIPVDLCGQVIQNVKQRLRGLGFDVVPESDHLHVEYDPKDPNTGWIARLA